MRMTSRPLPIGFAGLSAMAGLSALLVHCTRPDDAVTPEYSVDSPVRPEERVPQAGPPETVDMTPKVAPEPRKATPEEVERMLAERKAQGYRNPVSATPPPAGEGALAKAAALTPCMVNFNTPSTLANLPGHGQSTMIFSPFYTFPCNNNAYFVKSFAYNYDHFHLMPENTDFCYGTGFNLGVKSGAQCISQSDAMYWPRYASNMGANTGAGFYVMSSGNTQKLFDLKSIVIRSGAVAEVWFYKYNSGWHYYPNLAPAYWTFPSIATQLYEVDVRQSGAVANGVVNFDNLEIAINP